MARIASVPFNNENEEIHWAHARLTAASVLYMQKSVQIDPYESARSAQSVAAHLDRGLPPTTPRIQVELRGPRRDMEPKSSGASSCSDEHQAHAWWLVEGIGTGTSSFSDPYCWVDTNMV
ncbi:hypothetical protein B0H13DRAFT_1879864 [Mycena leptocephala]|nr:hypothetical protein B0H13DRAFT_1879864 [Mycena leptocephala]